MTRRLPPRHQSVVLRKRQTALVRVARLTAGHEVLNPFATTARTRYDVVQSHTGVEIATAVKAGPAPAAQHSLATPLPPARMRVGNVHADVVRA